MLKSEYITISPLTAASTVNTSRTLLPVQLLKLPSSLTLLLFSNLSTGKKSTNTSNIRFFLSHTRLSTAQPAYLHNLISVQPPGRTRLSSVVTIARPPSSFSFKITDCSFRYASPSPSLWNNLPASFRQPHSSSVTTITPPITSSLFHSRLKTHLFHKSFTP